MKLRAKNICLKKTGANSLPMTSRLFHNFRSSDETFVASKHGNVDCGNGIGKGLQMPCCTHVSTQVPLCLRCQVSCFLVQQWLTRAPPSHMLSQLVALFLRRLASSPLPQHPQIYCQSTTIVCLFVLYGRLRVSPCTRNPTTRRPRSRSRRARMDASGHWATPASSPYAVTVLLLQARLKFAEVTFFDRSSSGLAHHPDNVAGAHCRPRQFQLLFFFWDWLPSFKSKYSRCSPLNSEVFPTTSAAFASADEAYRKMPAATSSVRSP